MIHCACLVIEATRRLLLVRVRDNSLHYFAGGKIEAGESARDALDREILEELGARLKPGTVEYLTTIRGAALDSDDTVELVCFSGELMSPPVAHAEISEISWISKSDRHLMAPAVRSYCEHQYDG